MPYHYMLQSTSIQFHRSNYIQNPNQPLAHEMDSKTSQTAQEEPSHYFNSNEVKLTKLL